jgi:PAN domain
MNRDAAAPHDAGIFGPLTQTGDFEGFNVGHNCAVGPLRGVFVMKFHSFAIPNPIRAVRSTFALLLFVITPLAAYAGDNQNRPGSDYANFDAASAFVCANTCAGESQCKAYTFVRPGIQGPSGHCWLKNATPQAVSDGCCFSGLHPNGAGMMRAEDKTDRAGSDINSFEIAGWQNCQSACQNEGSCSSWTYVRPGIQGPGGRCWLKNAVARPFSNPGTVSGVKFKAASVRFD